MYVSLTVADGAAGRLTAAFAVDVPAAGVDGGAPGPRPRAGNRPLPLEDSSELPPAVESDSSPAVARGPDAFEARRGSPTRPFGIRSLGRSCRTVSLESVRFPLRPGRRVRRDRRRAGGVLGRRRRRRPRRARRRVVWVLGFRVRLARGRRRARGPIPAVARGRGGRPPRRGRRGPVRRRREPHDCQGRRERRRDLCDAPRRLERVGARLRYELRRLWPRARRRPRRGADPGLPARVVPNGLGDDDARLPLRRAARRRGGRPGLHVDGFARAPETDRRLGGPRESLKNPRPLVASSSLPFGFFGRARF